MAETLPPPPVPADADLTSFKFMPLEVARLRRSKAWLICKRKPELAFYMLNLWTASWHELPAGSLDDDDDVLADAAMCSPDKWAKVRADVMRGWAKHADGRLYHPVVAEKVMDSWFGRLMDRWRKECDRLRKENKKRAEKGEPALDLPPEPKRTSVDRPSDGQRNGGGIPAEKPLKGEGREKEREVVTTASPSPPAEPPPLAIDDDDLEPPLPLDRSEEARVVVAWNAAADEVNADLGHAEWPKVKTIGTKRKAAIKRLLKAHTHADIEHALRKAMADPWARGQTKRPPEHADWRFHFDHFATEQTVTKYLERPDGERPRSHERNPDERSTTAALAGLAEAGSR